MSGVYRSQYEAYPFLADAPDDLRCDFELLTDEVASLTGLIRAEVQNEALRAELARVGELVYHANPTLRTRFTVTPSEVQWLLQRREEHELAAGQHSLFVLPLGCRAGALCQLARVRGKELVRLLYRHIHSGGTAPDALIDFCNILSGYFFALALRLDSDAGEQQVPFESRNYTSK